MWLLWPWWYGCGTGTPAHAATADCIVQVGADDTVIRVRADDITHAIGADDTELEP